MNLSNAQKQNLEDEIDCYKSRVEVLKDQCEGLYIALFNLRVIMGGTPRFQEADKILDEYEKRVKVKWSYPE